MPSKHDCLSVLIGVRRYTLELLHGLDEDDWYRMPDGCPTHIAWQVGHITYAQLGVALVRSRGPAPGDADVLPAEYETLFGKGTTPQPDRSHYPSVESLRETMQRVNHYVLEQLKAQPEEFFQQPPAVEFLGMKTRGEVIRFCALHEMLHNGQIGLVRRMLGEPPLR